MQRLIADIKSEIASHPARSAWDKGVREYAKDLFDGYVEGRHLSDDIRLGKITEQDLMNGAKSWEQFSYGGCAEVYDGDICERLCSPSEQKKTKGGELKLHGEEWLDLQAKALRQAARLVVRIVNKRGLIMSLISKDAVQAAFDNADADVLADYGPEYGTEWGFSRDAVNRILTTAFASEEHFEPGQEVWIIERDEDGEAHDVGGYVFLAEVAGYAILSPYVNDHGDLEYLLDYHRRDTCTDFDTDLPVVYLDDCYPSQAAAHRALDEEVGEDDC